MDRVFHSFWQDRFGQAEGQIGNVTCTIKIMWYLLKRKSRVSFDWLEYRLLQCEVTSAVPLPL